jgi:hypothetical protein
VVLPQALHWRLVSIASSGMAGQAHHLGVAGAGRHHRIAILAAAHHHIHEGRSRMGQGPAQASVEVLAIGDGDALDAKGLSQGLKVGHAAGHFRGGIALAIEAFLPLAHHALPAVVEDHHLHRQLVLGQGA